MSKWWVITFHESDGNDATVFDHICKAGNEQRAKDIWWNDLLTDNPDWEGDGDWGFYFPCTCQPEPGKGGERDAEEFECPGHGGLVFREIQGPFESEDEAHAHTASYHEKW